MNQLLTPLVLNLRNTTTSCHTVKGNWSSISGRFLEFFSLELLKNNGHIMKKLLSLMLTSKPLLKDIMNKMGDLLNDLNGVTETLKDIQDVVKEDHILNKKVIEATKAYTKNSTFKNDSFDSFSMIMTVSSVNALRAHALKQDEELAAWAKSSTNMAWNLGSRLSNLEQAQTHIQSSMSSLKEDMHSINTMMTEMYEVFKGQSSNSVTLTLALTHIPANINGENDTNTATEDPPSYTEGETDANRQEKFKEPKHSTDANIEFIEFIGKCIATDEQVKDQRKLIKAPSIICPDLNAYIPYIINGEVYYLTTKKLHAHMNKEEQIKKAKEEARLFAISKPEVIKVVQEEAKKLGIHLKEAITTKAGEKFKKAQDTEHEVLKRQHTEKVRKSLKLRKHKYERIRKIPEELGIKSALPAPTPAPEHALSKSSRKKRKHMEFEPEIKIPGLECNRALPENVLFVNNMVIEEPEHGIFFTDDFGDQAFQRWSDINKVGIEALVSYLVVSSMV
ncbi:hypothetical protein Tco_0312202 [Tanacetum coccineum]